jgi:hypothetical protein
MSRLKISAIIAGITAAAAVIGLLDAAEQDTSKAAKAHKGLNSHFETSDRCIACHNGLTTPNGEDISIGFNWRASIMANAGRDPYWMAGVRRETIDHPTANAAIQDECSICHMPMARFDARQAGHEGEIFAHLPPNPKKASDRLAADGVSCSLCHQIQDEGLGTRASFVGGFKIDVTRPLGDRRVYGPYEIDAGHTKIMKSSSGFQPTEAKYIKKSELCATCHTLYTQALDPQGKVIGELPEQMPYLEWVHSSYYNDENTCQSCHMPAVKSEVAITSVLGKPRPEFSRHTFVGGNFFMQRVLNRYRADLSVAALPQELDAAANRTIEHLQTEAARVSIDRVEIANGRLQAEISVENLGGHKLPTAYPSRRVWLHVSVKDRNNRVVFESGALAPDGHIQGNDNDADATKFEPHYTEITSPEQVQIYESVMVDPQGVPTTGLLTAVRYIKDNRLLPKGFDKKTADKDIAVQGGAYDDPDFTGGGDKIRYSVTLGDAQGPFHVDAELWYQPIAYRWAENLRKYNAMEPQRWVRYYESMASGSGVVLAHASAQK